MMDWKLMSDVRVKSRNYNVLTKKALWTLNTCIRTCLLHDLESGRMKMWVTLQVGPRLLGKIGQKQQNNSLIVNVVPSCSVSCSVSTISVVAFYCSAALPVLSKGNQRSATCLCSALSWTNKSRTLF